MIEPTRSTTSLRLKNTSDVGKHILSALGLMYMSIIEQDSDKDMIRRPAQLHRSMDECRHLCLVQNVKRR